MKKINKKEFSKRTQVFTNAKNMIHRFLTSPLGEDFYNFKNDDTEINTNGMPKKHSIE